MTETAECPRQESNLRTRFRRALLYPLSYGGGNGKPSPDTPHTHPRRDGNDCCEPNALRPLAGGFEWCGDMAQSYSGVPWGVQVMVVVVAPGVVEDPPWVVDWLRA